MTGKIKMGNEVVIEKVIVRLSEIPYPVVIDRSGDFIVCSNDKNGLAEIRARASDEICCLVLEDGRSMNIIIENMPSYISSLPIRFQVTGKINMPEAK